MAVLLQDSYSTTYFSHRYQMEKLWSRRYLEKCIFRISQRFFTLMSFQTCLILFLKRRSFEKCFGGLRCCLVATVFFKILSFMFHWRKTFIRVLNDMRMIMKMMTQFAFLSAFNNSFYHYPRNYSRFQDLCFWCFWLGNIEEQMLKDCQTGIYYSCLA